MLANQSSGATAAHTSHAHAAATQQYTPPPIVQHLQDAISTHAAAHVLNVVRGHATQHAASQAAHGHAAGMVHTPSFRQFAQHQDVPTSPLVEALLRQIQQQMQDPNAYERVPGQQYTMGQGGFWQPYQAPPGGFAPQGAPPAPQPYQPTGNDSIASNGGGNGILGQIMHVFGQ